MHPRRALPLCVLLLGSSILQAQTADTATVFKADVRTVVIDVVVTGKNGQPVTGLHKEDFQTLEDGHSQAVTSFEEHGETEHSTSKPEPALPPLPPNIFTNIPRVAPTDSVTVLLLDALNTQLADQATVHRQMLKYLKTLDPGRRVAILTMGRQLRFVQGFTDDPALLLAALNSTTRAGGPQGSPILNSYAEQLSQDESLLPPSPDQNKFFKDQRILLTLNQFQQVASYLAGIPGRKNLVWFSSSFPSVLFAPMGIDSYDFEEEYGDLVRRTTAQLDAAQVAVYPVAAEGTAPDSINDPEHVMVGIHNAYDAQQAINNTLQQDTLVRGANHATMDEIAKETGGEAIYNTNGLGDALARVIDHGSHYYTLSYTPTKNNADGQFRHIEVKVNSGRYKLAYRHGYYAADAKTPKLPSHASTTKSKHASTSAPAHAPPTDPLVHAMVPGLPDSTQIPIALRIQPGKPTTSAKPAGDNGDLKGPLTRYSVDFVIAARGLHLDPTADGGRSGKIEATLVVYDQLGKPVNWLVRQIDLTMDAARFATVQENGVNFRLDIDIPKEGATLRSGVYDWNSSLIGTLEIPLSHVTTSTQRASVKPQ